MEYNTSTRKFKTKLKRALKESRNKWNKDTSGLVHALEACGFCFEFAEDGYEDKRCKICKKLFWGNVDKKAVFEFACLKGITSKNSTWPTWKEDCKKMERKFKRIEKKYLLNT